MKIMKRIAIIFICFVVSAFCIYGLARWSSVYNAGQRVDAHNFLVSCDVTREDRRPACYEEADDRYGYLWSIDRYFGIHQNTDLRSR
jgi:hypothetical protein